MATILDDELVEVRPRGQLVAVDTQGERALSIDGAFALANRIVDEALKASGQCPLRPLLDRVVVAVIEEANRKSEGGVHIPDTARDDCERGVVVAIGPGRYERASGFVPIVGIAVGDIVTMSRHAGTDVKTSNDRVFRSIRGSDILAVVVAEPHTP